ncbi:probable E3 SUMO-protein ligase RNF212 isoform X1 [Mustela erminea]|uniref:probable E3 SUMO-protein ligase RNF212 isoform X1 n=1 Tax=Mustela erminea TaxID=36723 RepID=UPI0013870777|nr:probable E3 SUMO-protein ligase RNF212 isoform X1 [Mustela erminea]
MASWVFCNRCFQPPHRTSCFSLTNCGHVYCDVCLGKGGKNECLICKAPCRTVFLSKHTDADIQALFMGIDGLCKKYSRETCQISEFQEKHRKRLLAFYREKITKLEESLRRSALRMEQLQGMRLSQQTAFSAVKTPVSTPSAKPDGHLLLPPDTSASDRVESMQIDHTPSLVRKVSIRVPGLLVPHTASFHGFPWCPEHKPSPNGWITAGSLVVGCAEGRARWGVVGSIVPGWPFKEQGRDWLKDREQTGRQDGSEAASGSAPSSQVQTWRVLRSAGERPEQRKLGAQAWPSSRWARLPPTPQPDTAQKGEAGPQREVPAAQRGSERVRRVARSGAHGLLGVGASRVRGIASSASCSWPPSRPVRRTWVLGLLSEK